MNDKRYVNMKRQKLVSFVSWDKKEKLATPYAAGAVDNEIFQKEVGKKARYSAIGSTEYGDCSEKEWTSRSPISKRDRKCSI